MVRGLLFEIRNGHAIVMSSGAHSMRESRHLLAGKIRITELCPIYKHFANMDSNQILPRNGFYSVAVCLSDCFGRSISAIIVRSL